MNNNLENYLSRLDNHHKNSIIHNCKKNNHFDQFISCSSKLNISLFNNDDTNTPKTHKYLIKKFKDYKEIIVKSFGLKIVKDYKNNMDNITKFIKINYKKLETKLNYINLLINILENIIDSDNLYLLLKSNVFNRKINYSSDNRIINTTEKMQFVEFSQDLFITSDELTTSEDNKQDDSVNLIYSQNTPFIAEYSN